MSSRSRKVKTSTNFFLALMITNRNNKPTIILNDVRAVIIQYISVLPLGVNQSGSGPLLYTQHPEEQLKSFVFASLNLSSSFLG